MIESEFPETILFLDYDGTLSDIRESPGSVFLSKSEFDLLDRLTKDHTIVVISGRSFTDIQKRVPSSLSGISGDHGAVRQYLDQIYTLPEVQSTNELTVEIASEISQIKGLFSGLEVEQKDYSISIHYRNVAPSILEKMKNNVLEIKIRVDKKEQLRVTNGKCVIEFRHPEATKEKAMQWFIELINKDKEKSRIVMVGDDLTDWNSILLAEQSGGRGVWVGREFPTLPPAGMNPLKIESPAQVWDSLKGWEKKPSFIPFS